MIKWIEQTNSAGTVKSAMLKVGVYSIEIRKKYDKSYSAYLDGNYFAEFRCHGWEAAKGITLNEVQQHLADLAAPMNFAVDVITEILDTWGT
jgi:hypothetical protein